MPTPAPAGRDRRRKQKAPRVPSGGCPTARSGLGLRLAGELQVLRRALAVLAALQIVLHTLTLAQAVQTCPLDGRDVHERVRAAAIRLDEAEALGRIEPLHCSSLQD